MLCRYIHGEQSAFVEVDFQAGERGEVIQDALDSGKLIDVDLNDNERIIGVLDMTVLELKDA